MIGIRVSTLLCLIMLSYGCGYQFVAGGPGPVIGGGAGEERLRAIQAKAPNLVVEPVLNRTFEPNLEERYTEFFRREFAASSGAKVVPDAGSAQFRLQSSIDSVSVPSLSFARSSTFESRVSVSVTARVQEVGTKKVLWREQVSASSEFFVTEDIQFNRVLQTRALEQAGKQIASDLAARFLLHLETTLEAEPEPSATGAPGVPAEESPPTIPPLSPSGTEG